MEARAKWASAVTAVILLATLTGCDPHLFEGPVLARLGESGIEFMLCERVVAQEIFVEERELSEAQSSDTIWVAEGEATLALGDVIRLGEELSGLSTSLYEPEFITSNSTIAIALSPTSESNPVVTGEFDFAQLSATPGEWYDSAGASVDRTCDET